MLQILAILLVLFTYWPDTTFSLSVAPKTKVKTKSPTFSDLQKCITPNQMLQEVGVNLPCHTSNDGILILSSTLLVRLSKQMVHLDNQNKFSLLDIDDTELIKKGRHLDYQDWSWSPIENVVQALITNGSWNTSPSTIEAAVEGTKAAAVLARLCPDLATSVWNPLINQWHDISETTSSNLLLPHQLSGLKWAMDCFQVVQQGPEVDQFLPLALQHAYDAMNLPFCIRPGAMYAMKDLTVPTLLDQVDFQVDDIKTTSNKLVPERRETAWEGDENVAPFQYSGKSMPRRSWSPLVKAVRDCLYHQTGTYYDGCLLNHYPDGGSGMRYHIDPDQGTLWDYATTVVSVGATRKFAFRELAPQDASYKPHVFTLLQGDCTEMFGNCQERFQHTVRTAEVAEEAAARASLVFKKTWNSPPSPTL